MGDIWLVSVPFDRTAQETLDNVASSTSSMGVTFRFPIPELKVGTLDTLVALTDELGKHDSFCESVTRKLVSSLNDVLDNERDKLAENLLANNVDLTTYVTKFQWDAAKYPVKQPLRNISEIIVKQVTQVDSDLKSKTQQYNALKQQLQALERKQTGSLFTRSLTDIVKKEHFVSDSEHFETVVVIVPNAVQSDWLDRYETLVQLPYKDSFIYAAIPRSSQQIFTDADNSVFTVTIFKTARDQFKQKCREFKFIVRDFTYDEKTVQNDKEEATRLSAEQKKQFPPLVRWLKINFSEVYVAWAHIKALRVFTESVLRYGLPVKFVAMAIVPAKKSVKRLREELQSKFAYLDTNSSSEHSSLAKDAAALSDIPGMAAVDQDYYPYVFFSISTNLTEGVTGHRM